MGECCLLFLSLESDRGAVVAWKMGFGSLRSGFAACWLWFEAVRFGGVITSFWEREEG